MNDLLIIAIISAVVSGIICVTQMIRDHRTRSKWESMNACCGFSGRHLYDDYCHWMRLGDEDGA